MFAVGTNSVMNCRKMQAQKGFSSRHVAGLFLLDLVGTDRGLGLGDGRSLALLLLFLGVLGTLSKDLAVFGFGLLGSFSTGTLK